jgi:hypothetical protein
MQAKMAKGTFGFDEWKKHILGEADGTPRTPEWAEKICDIPAHDIKALAREWAAKKTMIAVGSIFGATGACREAYATEWARLCVLLMAMQGFGKVGFHTAEHLLKDKVPNWEWLRGATLKIAVAHGTANARRVMENIKAGGLFGECHFIEFMACPGGCLGGGGQPIPTSKEIREAPSEWQREIAVRWEFGFALPAAIAGADIVSVPAPGDSELLKEAFANLLGGGSQGGGAGGA